MKAEVKIKKNKSGYTTGWAVYLGETPVSFARTQERAIAAAEKIDTEITNAEEDGYARGHDEGYSDGESSADCSDEYDEGYSVGKSDGESECEECE